MIMHKGLGVIFDLLCNATQHAHYAHSEHLTIWSPSTLSDSMMCHGKNDTSNLYVPILVSCIEKPMRAMWECKE